MSGIHVEDFPVVTVEVQEAAQLHETIVLGWLRLASASFHGGVGNSVYLGFAVYTNRDQHFGGASIGNLLVGKFAELLVGQKHRVDVVGNYEARCSLIGKLWIECPADGLKESHRLVQVFHGKVDEDLGAHERSCC